MSVPAFDFVTGWLPKPPARVLEVGCGDGALTRALIDRGYDVLGVDPAAPDGPSFVRTRIEELRVDRRYDAAVAIVSLHHVDDLPAAVDRLADAVGPGGLLVVDEFDRERLDEPTTTWWFRQRQALAAIGAGTGPEPTTAEEYRAAVLEALADVFGWSDVHDALARRFEQQALERVPYLYRFATHLALEPLERAMIDVAALQPTGVRYVGLARG